MIRLADRAADAGYRTWHTAQGWAATLAGVVAAFCLTASIAHAETTTFPDIQSILDRRKLRVGLLDHDIPPFLVTAEDGALSGIDVRIARGLAKRLGVDPEFVRTADTADALIRQAAEGEVDIAISFITRTLDRAMLVRFSRPYLSEHIAFALNRRVALQSGADCPESPDDVAGLAGHGLNVGAQRGTVFEKALKDRGLQDSTTLFDSIQEMLEAVESGSHMGGLAGEVALRYALKARPALLIKIKLCLVGEQKDNIAVAVRPDAPNLADWIDIAFENVSLSLDPMGVLSIDADWAL